MNHIRHNQISQIYQSSKQFQYLFLIVILITFVRFTIKSKEKRSKTYNLKSFESISHGDIGHIGWDFVLLTEKLKISSGKAIEIHGDDVEKETEKKFLYTF